MFKVQKKDGTTEDFDRTKIINGLERAGASPEEVQKVAQEIENWLPAIAVNGVVKSSDIRNKGLEVLAEVNPTIAAKYQTFKKSS